MKKLLILVFLLMAATAWSATINVSTVSQLHNAVSSGGGNTIVIADGTYRLNDTLYVNASNVTIRSASGIRENVVIQGAGMSSGASIGNIFRVAGNNFSLSDVTLERCGWHTIQIVGVDNPVIRNCVLRDAYEQIVKVSDEDISDNGLVEGCLFEYTAGIGPQYYIGGVDAHRARNWVVRNNVFRNIISPNTTVAEFAVHFWGSSSENLVEKNLIINCDRGIGFGLDGRGNTGGIIRNNMIYHANNKGSYADASIVLTDSPNSQIYNNTVYMEHGFQWAIEYRFSSTRNILITNNLLNKRIEQRDGASGTVTNNKTNASSGLFVNVSSGDLHLVDSIGGGNSISGLVDDFDSDIRSGVIDMGADQFSGGVVPPPPPPSLNKPDNFHRVE